MINSFLKLVTEPESEPKVEVEVEVEVKPKVSNRPKKYDKAGNKLVAGMRKGNLILRRKLPVAKDKAKLKPQLREIWRCECACGNVIDVPKYYLVRKPNPKTHCGCQSGSARSKFNREYRIWLMIRKRTRDPNHVAYEHYNKRGIDICDEWYDMETGFELFLEDIGPRPTKYHTCDRINNSKGYQPGNVMWATPTQQRANQGNRIGGKTPEEIEELGYSEEEWIEAVKNGEV